MKGCDDASLILREVDLVDGAAEGNNVTGLYAFCNAVGRGYARKRIQSVPFGRRGNFKAVLLGKDYCATTAAVDMYSFQDAASLWTG